MFTHHQELVYAWGMTHSKTVSQLIWIVLKLRFMASLELGLRLSANGKVEAVLVLTRETGLLFPNIYFCQWEWREKSIRIAWCGWNSLTWPRPSVCPRSRVAKVTRKSSALDQFGSSLVWIFLLNKSREECYDPLLFSFLGLLLASGKALGQEQHDTASPSKMKQRRSSQALTRWWAFFSDDRTDS